MRELLYNGQIDLMETVVREAIQMRARMCRVVVRPPKPKPPLLLPSRWRGVLYGPDGKQLEG